MFPAMGYCMYSPISYKFFQPLSLSGAIKFGGYYRSLDGYSNEVYNYQKGSLIYGGVLLNTSSYFLHPNFLVLDLGIEYNPEKGHDAILIVPDQSEIRTLKRLNINTTFFRQKKITIGAFANFNQVFNNRENLSNIKIDNSDWGGNISVTNKYIPFTGSYIQGKIDELEIQTGRLFITRYKNIEARISKNFSPFDMNELGYSHNDFMRQDVNLAPTRNICDNLYLNDNIYFNKLRTSNLISNITGTYQVGNDAFRRFQAMENVSFALPKNFDLSGIYNFNYTQRDFQRIDIHNVGGILRHRLYQSLTSELLFEFNKQTHTLYKERNEKAGIDFIYEKNIPKGQLSLSYRFFWQRQNRNGEANAIRIFNEEHSLTDGQMELLKKAYADPLTVVVKDVTGTIIFQPNFDYILIQRNSFIEMQRMPGGRIANKSTVYVDYTSMQPGSYQYDVNFHCFSASVILFNRIVEFYYRLTYQDYHNLKTTEYLTLNYFTQNIFGIRLEYKFASGGVEYETYSSTIVPYRSVRYYLTLQGSSQNRFLYSLNGNVRDIYLIDDSANQKYIDITGKISYLFTPQISFNVEAGYRKQIGERINLDLLIARAEFLAVIRQMSFRIGFETYKRDNLNEKTNFIGGYITIARTFNWNKR
jgi:hypothetical protein